MNTRKTVYNKLFKEETQLAKHEVELGAIDDLQNKFKAIAAKAPKLKDQIISLSNQLSGVSDELGKLQSDFKKLELMAKELGADSVEQTAKTLFDITGRFSSDWGKAASNINNAAKTI
jgi:chromosome segregation ATPase